MELDEIDALRWELQSSKAVSLAVIQRQQAEIEDLKKRLARSEKFEREAQQSLDSMYEQQQYHDDKYAACSGGYGGGY